MLNQFKATEINLFNLKIKWSDHKCSTNMQYQHFCISRTKKLRASAVANIISQCRQSRFCPIAADYDCKRREFISWILQLSNTHLVTEGWNLKKVRTKTSLELTWYIFFSTPASASTGASLSSFVATHLQTGSVSIS